jgi:DNA end-binding protein Ku
VSCPVYLSATTSDSKRIKLGLLSERTGNPVREQFVDAKTGDVVAIEALVKGFEFETARYVTVSEDELKKLGSAAHNIIDLEHFVPRDQIDRLYIDSAYYVHPEGRLAADTVHALYLAMQRNGRAALGHIRIGESERPAMIEPYRGGLMMSTLRTEDELVHAHFPSWADNEIPTEMIEIADAIISRRAAEFDGKTLRDRFEDDLRQLIDEKVKSAPPAPREEPPPPPPLHRSRSRHHHPRRWSSHLRPRSLSRRRPSRNLSRLRRPLSRSLPRLRRRQNQSQNRPRRRSLRHLHPSRWLPRSRRRRRSPSPLRRSRRHHRLSRWSP